MKDFYYLLLGLSLLLFTACDKNLPGIFPLDGRPRIVFSAPVVSPEGGFIPSLVSLPIQVTPGASGLVSDINVMLDVRNGDDCLYILLEAPDGTMQQLAQPCGNRFVESIRSY